MLFNPRLDFPVYFILKVSYPESSQLLQQNLLWRVTKTLLCYSFWTPWYDTFNWKASKNPPKSQLSSTTLCWRVMTPVLMTLQFLKENKFKLHLKVSLLIKRSEPELNKNICSYPWLIAFIICILLFTYLHIWANYPCNFFDIQLLIAVHCYLKMLLMREGSESLFC